MIKQVIVARKDLEMPPGKLAAQAAHASVNAIMNGLNSENSYDFKTDLKEWYQYGYTKICLAVNSEEELNTIYEAAEKANLPCSYIVDEGRTCFNHVATSTCVGIGPADNQLIDQITGALKLY